MDEIHYREIWIKNVVVGTGTAGYNAASRLYQFGETDVVILTEQITAGTSRNTGSDKQTYYKLSLAGADKDSIRILAEDLFAGQCVDGDIALCEAALSVQCFYHLVELGVPFPCNEYGEFLGYKTDHDWGRRATSAGPYTSKIMTECLEKDVSTKQIPVLDGIQMVRLLTEEKKLRGILCLDRNQKEQATFLIIWCQNVILATGGPAGMYHDSVYPVSQLGSSGIAFAAGVVGKNLTEWQFGIASLKPRWNVSGTYMQVIPRFVSTDKDGSDEKEFLTEYFEKPEEMLSMIFLKGYQWPFDTNKIEGGSSIIDLLVYQETILKGRRVFLDYTKNPALKDIPYEKLLPEAETYLQQAGACFGIPYERLEHMNKQAVEFYRSHGIDLKKDMLEIAVCVQHNNGGLATDEHWQTNIEGIYAVGEVCGSHGVTRPGGTALNAGQVGSYRAAEHIAWKTRQEYANKEHLWNQKKAAWYILCKKDAELYMEKWKNCHGEYGIGILWEQAARRMSCYGGMIRERKGIELSLEKTELELKNLENLVKKPKGKEIGLFYHLCDMLLAQKVYLSAMCDYIEVGGGSRGSALYTCQEGKKPGNRMPELFRYRLDQGAHGSMIQEIEMKGGRCCFCWRPVRKIPELDYFFENQWKAYQMRTGK